MNGISPEVGVKQTPDKTEEWIEADEENERLEPPLAILCEKGAQ